jgi:hypothetical protein
MHDRQTFRTIFTGVLLALALSSNAAVADASEDQPYMCLNTDPSTGKVEKSLTPKAQAQNLNYHAVDDRTHGLNNRWSCRPLDPTPVYLLLTKSPGGAVSLTGGLTEWQCEKARELLGSPGDGISQCFK